MNNRNRLTAYILTGLVLGIVIGYIANISMADPVAFAEKLQLISFAFLRLIKMIIAPLVFSTLVVGIARMGDASEVGRIGGKALLWFVIASVISLSLGLILVNLFQPGVGMPVEVGKADISTGSLTLKEFITHLIPSSIVDGMAKNEILQIVVFSLFFGTAAAAVGERAKPMIDAIDGVAHVMLKLTGYVMNFAPIAVFASVCAVIAKSGLSVLANLGAPELAVADVHWRLPGESHQRGIGGQQNQMLGFRDVEQQPIERIAVRPATTAFQSLSMVNRGRADRVDADGRPVKIDSCYVYGAERELVRMVWPQFHRPSAEPGDT